MWNQSRGTLRLSCRHLGLNQRPFRSQFTPSPPRHLKDVLEWTYLGAELGLAPLLLCIISFLLGGLENEFEKLCFIRALRGQWDGMGLICIVDLFRLRDK